jgi:hypothetical protein
MSDFGENHDGLRNRNEMNDQREFQRGDLNRDGVPNRNEMNDRREFQREDLNRDGALNRGEFGSGDSMLINN